MKHRGSVGRGIGLNEDDCEHDAQKETLRKHACKRTCGEGKEGGGRLAVDSATAAYHESF